MSDLTPARSRALLEELVQRLAERQSGARVLVVGGAAIALMAPDRRSTRDIDCVILPAGVADAIIDDMTHAHGLDDGWINASALAFFPPVGLEDWHEVMRMDEVSVCIASPDMLLAMKLFANRVSRDWDDIRFLLAHLGITSVEQAQAIYERYHAQDVIPDSAVARLEAWLATRGAAGGS